MKGKQVFALSVISLAVSQAVYAEPGVLPEVSVTSTTIDDRFTSKRSEPASVHDISAQVVDEKRPENMIELLRTIPGVTADLSSGDEIKIKLRGVENQRYMGEKPGVAIVIDGVPVFERTGKVNIDLDNIQSIKVIKGGASYLFGDDGLAGAVIITTKRGAKYKGFTVAADAGSWNYTRQLARAGFAGDWGSGHIQASHRAGDDYYWQSNYKTDAVDGNARIFLSDASDLTLGFEKSDRIKDKHGNVKGATQAALDPQGTIGRDYTRKYDVNLQKIYATYSNDLSERSNVLATVYEYRDHTIFWSAPQNVTGTNPAIQLSPNTPGYQELYTLNNDYRQTQRGVKGEWRSSADNVGWLAGLDMRQNEYVNFTSAKVTYCSKTGQCPKTGANPTLLVTAGTTFTDNKTKEAVNALYGEFKFQPTSQWTLTMNGRYDDIKLDFTSGRTNEITVPFSRSKGFGVSSWRGGANYAVNENTNLFGNISTGFRAPTADQLFNGTLSPAGGKTLNNENLKPEESLNLELGARAKSTFFGVAADIETAIFQIERKNFILDVNGQYSTNTAAAQQMYDNIGGVRNRGFELSLKTDRKRIFTLDTAYSYIKAEFTRYDNFGLTLGSPYAPNPNIRYYNNTGKDVPRVPHHQLNMSFGWQPAEPFRLALEMDAKSWSWADEINQEKWAGRTLFNLAANYDIREKGLLGAKWSLFARVNNLLDKRYWSAARGTGDSANYRTGAYSGTYDTEDLSIIVGKPRSYTAGLTLSF
ncbi:TonB-dependent receptor [Candidatus Ferrigenium straubiae]|jgi:iron complex outermembrane receptor protein|uniref:TonB-dependent receptor n=1 Tax=Candidatus Ferrigenium straubiae TaxID=2919506 RepID=UPI003F4AD293